VGLFYDERIKSGKKQHPLPNMTEIFAEVLSQMTVPTQQKKETEISALDQAMIEKSTQNETLMKSSKSLLLDVTFGKELVSSSASSSSPKEGNED
jgi:hypothetical protein